MRLRMFQIDAFADRLFSGNPAAVCPLEEWLPDELLQAIAAENNLAETAFFVGGNGAYHLRWFTPACEVDLCGHATLASAYVIFTHLEPQRSRVAFQSQSGLLEVSREGNRLALDFPARPPQACPVPGDLAVALGAAPRETLRSRDYFFVYDAPGEVAALRPDFRRLAELDALGIICTAAGGGPGVDFVSRFFAPGAGIDEDPVTGSAHCTLVPYWAARLGKRDLVARQISRRGGTLWCRESGERVTIAGQAVEYLDGTITVSEPRSRV